MAESRSGQARNQSGEHVGGKAHEGPATAKQQQSGSPLAHQAHGAQGAASAVGQQMHAWADRIRENAPREGLIGSAAGSVADRLHAGGRYLQEQSLSDMTEDVASIVRNNPLPAVLVGVGIGFLIGSAFRR